MKFLDQSGLTYLWGKIQNYSDAAAASAVNGLYQSNTTKIDPVHLPSYIDDVIEFGGVRDLTDISALSSAVPDNTDFIIVYDTYSKRFFAEVSDGDAEHPTYTYFYMWPDTEGKPSYSEMFNNNGAGDKGKIYVDYSTNYQYRWAGTETGLVEISTTSAIYIPGNSALKTATALGDIAAETSASTLSGKTISQVLDDILFKTDVPTVTAASGGNITLTGHTNGEVILEGTAGAPFSNLNFSVNQAKTNYKYVVDPSTGAINKNSTANQQITLTENTGTLSKSLEKKGPTDTNASTVSSVPSNFSEGTYYYKATQNIQAIDGVSYIDNKGESHTYAPDPNSFTGTFTIYVTKPVYSNGSLGSNSSHNASGSLSSSSVSSHTTNIISNGSTVVINFGAESNTEYREIFEYPNTKTISKVEYFDTTANTWKDITTGTYNSNDTATTANYKRWTTVEGSVKQGPRSVRFTLNNAA